MIRTRRALIVGVSVMVVACALGVLVHASRTQPPKVDALAAAVDARESAAANATPLPIAISRAQLNALRYPIPTYSPPAWTQGLFEGIDGPVPSFKDQNAWQGTVEGRRIVVYAGSDGEVLGLGRLVVCAVSGPSSDVLRTLWQQKDPVAKGAYRVKSVSGRTANISRADGATGTLDLGDYSLRMQPG